MDVYIEHKIKVQLVLDADELSSLRRLVGLADEYAKAKAFSLNELEAKVMGHIVNAYMQIPR